MSRFQLFVRLGFGGDGTTLNRDDSSVHRELTPVEGWRVSWGAPTGRDHPEAGDHSLTLVGPPAQAAKVTLDSGFELTCLIDEAYTAPIAKLWVDQISARTDPYTGLVELEPVLMDWYGRAAATRLSAQPWPQQTQAQRFTAINQASPAGPLVEGTDPLDVTLAARDVDSADALSVIRATVAPSRAIAVHGGFTTVPLPGAIYWPATVVQGYVESARIEPGPEVVVDVPAAAIVDNGRQLIRSSYITEARFTYHPGNDPTTTSTISTRNANPGRLTSAVWAVESDRVMHAAIMPGEMAWIASANPEPRYTLAPTELLLDQLDTPSLISLLSSETRSRVILAIRDTPPGVEPFQCIIGAQLDGDFGADTPLRLAVTLEPASLSGARPMRWRDFPESGPKATFANQGVIRISDLDLISNRGV